MPFLANAWSTLQLPAKWSTQIYDGEIPGLALRVNPTGRKVYALYYRTAAGRKRNFTLGAHGSITPEQARKLAKQRLAEVTRGGDPSGDRRRAPQAPPPTRQLRTAAEGR